MKEEQTLKYPELTQTTCVIAAENPSLVKQELDCFYLDHPAQDANDLLYKMYHGWLQYQAVLNADTDCDQLEEMDLYQYRLTRLLVAAYVTMREEKESPKVILQEGVGLVQSHPAVSPELAPVIELLIRVVQPEKVFLWRKSKGIATAEVDEVELLFLLQDRLQQKFAELQPQLDFIHAAKSHLHCNLCVNGILVEAFKNCDLFYLSHCNTENLIYDLSGKSLPQVASQDLLERKAKAESTFSWAIQLAHSFYAQSQQSVSDSPRLAALLLHQCAEHSYRALITAYRGKAKKTHDLFALNQEMEHLASGICVVFPADEEEGQRILSVLSTAYCQSRYQEDFSITEADLQELSLRVERLPALAESEFNQMMGMLDVGE